MTPEQREILRVETLVILDLNGSRFGLHPSAVRSYLAARGFTYSEEDVTKEVVYLKDRGLVDQPMKIISPERSAFRITAAGRDFIAERGY